MDDAGATGVRATRAHLGGEQGVVVEFDGIHDTLWAARRSHGDMHVRRVATSRIRAGTDGHDVIAPVRVGAQPAAERPMAAAVGVTVTVHIHAASIRVYDIEQYTRGGR